jgi:hypothetical protein
VPPPISPLSAKPEAISQVYLIEKIGPWPLVRAGWHG